MDKLELADAVEALPYQMTFNAIADACKLEWGGTAIGISVTTFQKSLAEALRSRSNQVMGDE